MLIFVMLLLRLVSIAQRTLEDDVLPKCFLPSIGIGGPDAISCLRIAQGISQSEKSSAPMHFSRDGGMGFALPHEYNPPHADCYVYVDFFPGAEEDATFPMRDISLGIIVLVQTCVENNASPQLGGTFAVGPELRVIVVVARHPLPDDAHLRSNILSNMTTFYLEEIDEGTFSAIKGEETF